MRIASDVLEAYDDLTSTEIPELEEGEWIRIRRRVKASRDMDAERAAYTSFLPSDDAPDPDETDGADPAPVEIKVSRYMRERFEYMCLGWHLHWADGTEVQWTRQDRDKIFDLFPQLVAEMIKRAGGIAKAPETGKKDADGAPLTFRQDRPLRGKGNLARSVDAGGVQPGAARTDRQGASV